MTKGTLTPPLEPQRQPEAGHSQLDTRELSSLRRRLLDLPDLRFEKVLSVRKALRNGTYDSDALVDTLVQRIEDDIGVLCRRDRG